MPERLSGRWLKRGGQENWRVMGVHVDNKHADLRQEDCRYTCGDLITLGLRDRTDIITGNWNQASNYLEECCYYAVRTYESNNNMSPGTIAWFISDPICENRTIFFNWPVKGRPYHMAIKEITTFINHSTEDFWSIVHSHKGSCSAIFMLRKWPVDEPTGSSRHFYPRSAETSSTAAAEPKDEDMERWTS